MFRREKSAFPYLAHFIVQQRCSAGPTPEKQPLRQTNQVMNNGADIPRNL